MTDNIDHIAEAAEWLNKEPAADWGEYEWRLFNVVEQAEDLRAEVDALEAKNERLSELDREYGHVECEIIFADNEFDGDSDHANCGDRLIASVHRLRDRAEAAEAKLAERAAPVTPAEAALKAAYLAGFNASGEGWNAEYPFEGHDPEQDDYWIDKRDEALRAIAQEGGE